MSRRPPIHTIHRPDRADHFLRLWETLQAAALLHVRPRYPGTLLDPVREHLFHPRRLWRLDLAWPDDLLAVEIEGVYSRPRGRKSRHTQPDGYQADCEKYNAAVLLGWRIMRFTPADLDRRPCQVIEDVVTALLISPPRYRTRLLRLADDNMHQTDPIDDEPLLRCGE